MIRAPMGDLAYWEYWTSFDQGTVDKNIEQCNHPPKNPRYRPQFVWDIAKSDILRLTLRRYSRGDPIPDLAQYFPGLLDAWELSNRLSDEICKEHHMQTCRAWTFALSDLNHYNWCFWLVGLALALEIPDDQWQRLLALIGGEGEDVLLDRVIASRAPARRIGNRLLHPKPYARLLKAIEAAPAAQPAALRDFVTHWYAELARKGKDELWWYVFGDPVKHPLEKGSYFGRWCVEAVAAVKAFGLDDSLCLGHEHYPGDLLRPDGPSTHKPRKAAAPQGVKGLWGRLLGR